MRSSRLTSLALLGGVIAGGLVLDAADDPSRRPGESPVEAGIALPAATPAGTLSSTWYCAGGTATPRGFADHVLLIGNPTDEARVATITVLTGAIAPPPVIQDTAAGGTSTTTTEAPATTTTTAPIPEAPAPSQVDLPAHSRVEVSLRELVEAPLAGAIVEVDGGQVAVEHQITTLAEGGGRATAPCSSTAARSWSFAWGNTERGSRELLVFMNPFPDDATVTLDLATDQGTRQPFRLQNFVVPGRSVVGAYLDEDTRRGQVSVQVEAGSGRVVVDRIQTFDGTNPDLEGITLALGAPVPAEVWTFPDGLIGEQDSEQVVVFNPTDQVAEAEVEIRLDDPDTNGVPEPYEITIPPRRYSIVDLHEPGLEESEDTPRRIPFGVGHSILVRALNGVPVVAERVLVRGGEQANEGVSAELGSPIAAPTWYVVGGGVTSERAEYVHVLNARPDRAATVSVSRLADGELVPIDDLQDLPIEAGGRVVIPLHDHVDEEVVPLVVTASGPVVVERALYRISGRGIVLAMGIPLAEDVLVLDPLDV